MSRLRDDLLATHRMLVVSPYRTTLRTAAARAGQGRAAAEITRISQVLAHLAVGRLAGCPLAGREMGKALGLLLVEDAEDDAQLVLLELARGGYDVDHLRV